MGHSHRKQRTFRRHLKKSLSRKFRYYPLLRLLVLKPWFRAAFLLAFSMAVFVGLYLPKFWLVSPQGFEKDVKVSWLDMTQCWALKRSARAAEAAGDFDNANQSWQMAVAQNPCDLPALRGCLNNLPRLKRPEAKTLSAAAGQITWLLRLTGTNISDVQLIAPLCDKFQWHDLTLRVLDPSREKLTGEAESAYIKALFHSGRFADFRERLARVPANDQSLDLYRLGYAMGWGAGPERDEAGKKLLAMIEQGSAGMRAARVYMVAAGYREDPETYAEGMKYLELLNEDTVGDHLFHWSLLAKVGQKPKAVRLAEDFSRSPRSSSETLLLANSYFALGLTNACREVLSQFVPRYSESAEGWIYYASFLQDMKDWPALRNLALAMREDKRLFGTLWGFSHYIEGLADLRQKIESGAARAFGKAGEATYESPFLGFRVAKELVTLRYSGPALKILSHVEDRLPSSPEFWETYFDAAYGAKDSQAVLKAAQNSYKLKPGDVQLHNRYAAALMLNRKDPEESIRLTLQLINAYPHSTAASINHAFALLLNRRAEEARKLLEGLATRQLAPLEANAYHLGLFEVYCTLELWDKAREQAKLVDTAGLFPNQLETFERLQKAMPQALAQS